MASHLEPQQPRMMLVRINPLGAYDGSTSAEEGNFETCNFVEHDGHYYGAIPKKDRVDLRRLGGGSKDAFVNDVTVAWVANRVVVGWYKNATVYAEIQKPHPANAKINYRATCLVHHGRELSEPERTFNVREAGARFGRSRRWYPQAIKDRLLLNAFARTWRTREMHH